MVVGGGIIIPLRNVTWMEQVVIWRRKRKQLLRMRGIYTSQPSIAEGFKLRLLIPTLMTFFSNESVKLGAVFCLKRRLSFTKARVVLTQHGADR